MPRCSKRASASRATSKQAVFWYERAAQGGNVRAMHNLATLLASGANGKPDYATALRWYTEAAEAGLRDSQFNTGLLLARGIGSKPDLPKAFQWFSLAAAQGDAEAARKRDELAARLSPADLKPPRPPPITGARGPSTRSPTSLRPRPRNGRPPWIDLQANRS